MDVTVMFVYRCATILMHLEVPELPPDGCQCHVCIAFCNAFHELGGAAADQRKLKLGQTQLGPRFDVQFVGAFLFCRIRSA